MKISRSQGYTRVIGPSNWKDTIVSTEMGKVVNSTVFRRRIRSSSLDIKVWNTHWTFNYKCWVGSWICKLWIWREVSDGNVYSSRCSHFFHFIYVWVISSNLFQFIIIPSAISHLQLIHVKQFLFQLLYI